MFKNTFLVDKLAIPWNNLFYLQIHVAKVKFARREVWNTNKFIECILDGCRFVCQQGAALMHSFIHTFSEM